MSDDDEDEAGARGGMQSARSRRRSDGSPAAGGSDPIASTQILRQRIEAEERLRAAQSLLSEHLRKVLEVCLAWAPLGRCNCAPLTSRAPAAPWRSPPQPALSAGANARFRASGACGC